jgi:hypothetical protein
LLAAGVEAADGAFAGAGADVTEGVAPNAKPANGLGAVVPLFEEEEEEEVPADCLSFETESLVTLGLFPNAKPAKGCFALLCGASGLDVAPLLTGLSPAEGAFWDVSPCEVFVDAFSAFLFPRASSNFFRSCLYFPSICSSASARSTNGSLSNTRSRGGMTDKFKPLKLA